MLQLPDLPSPYAEALSEALTFILDRYAVLGIVAAGRIIHGTPDPHSDLDLYVIQAVATRQRVQRRFHGVATEIFVNPPAAVRRYLVEERLRPVTAHMLATGTVLLALHPVVDELRREAADALAQPPDLREDTLTLRRYLAADLLENATDIAARDPENADLLLHDAVRATLDYAFLAANRPLPRVKDTLTTLAEVDPSAAALARAFYAAPDLTARLAAATRLAAHTLRATGFFEWESAAEAVADDTDEDTDEDADGDADEEDA